MWINVQTVESMSSSQHRPSDVSVQEKNPKDCMEDFKKEEEEEEEEEEVDPRIQIELDRLNEASDEINNYENQLDEARNKYRTTLSESSQELKTLARNKRKTISRARAYYELKVESKRVQEETIHAAGHYQMANSIYRAAKETIMLAEDKLTHAGQTAELSAAWQEMLNHATIRVMEAEREKRMREEEHHRTAKACAELELQMQMNEKLYKKSIEKARPYFEKKAEMEQELERQKAKVIALQEQLLEAKSEYAGALKKLEQISEELHEKRKSKAVFKYPREPGVGEESQNSECLTVNEMNLASLESDGEFSSETSSTDEKAEEAEEAEEAEDLSEKYRDLVDHMDSHTFPCLDTLLPLQQTPPTTPIFPSDSPTLPEFPGFVSPPSYNIFPSSPSSTFSSSSIVTCPSVSEASWLSHGFSSVSLNQTSSVSAPSSPDGQTWTLTVSPPLENRSVEGALDDDDISVNEKTETTDPKTEREKAPIKIFTAFREIFLSKPVVRSGAKIARQDLPKLQRQDTSEDDISI